MQSAKHLGTLKSLDPYGMTKEFLEITCNMLVPNVSKVFQEFFEIDFFVQIRIIFLIPKR